MAHPRSPNPNLNSSMPRLPGSPGPLPAKKPAPPPLPSYLVASCRTTSGHPRHPLDQCQGPVDPLCAPHARAREGGGQALWGSSRSLWASRSFGGVKNPGDLPT